MAQLDYGGIPVGGLATYSWGRYSIPGIPRLGSSGVRRLALSRIQEERARPAVFLRQINALAGPKIRREERRLKLGKQVRELERRIRSSINRHVVISARRRIRGLKKELEELGDD